MFFLLFKFSRFFVVAAIGAVVGDFGLVDLRLVLGYLLDDLHLLFYRVDQTHIFLFYYIRHLIFCVFFDEFSVASRKKM
jgi:hypothetical protein